MSEELRVFWLAFYGDYSNAVVFDNEMDALRYAVDNSMMVKRLFYGTSIKGDGIE